jgi:ABC-type branched-subunit amino acid transport system substrate-binding protein
MSPDEVTQANGAAEGLYFSNLYSDNGAALAQKYQTKYGTQPGDPVFVSMGYDGMKTLIAAAEIAQQKNISMPDALRQVNIQGTDYQINFQGKQYAEKYERLYKVTNGQFVQIEQ